MTKEFILGLGLSIFVLVIALFAVCSTFNPGGDGKGAYQVIETLKSADAHHTATLWNEAGGGAAGWCFQRVSVDAAESPIDLDRETERGGYVFSINCGSKVNLKWQNASQLNISYTNQNGGASIYQNPSSRDEKVKIFYEIMQ
jgi:hypothetical protein